jgi:type VI secretion system protein ImpK
MRLVDSFSELMAYALFLVKPESSETVTFEKASRDIDALLEKSRIDALERNYNAADYLEAKFAVCAWVDELLLCSRWKPRDEWRKHQLQSLHFGTKNAGVEFFERLALLSDENKPVREVYANCLALSFRGRYFPDQLAAELDEVKQNNLRKLLDKPLLATADADEGRLFPDGWRQGAARKIHSPFNPFDWCAVLIPIVSLAIVVELYFFYRNSLNYMVLKFFESLR